MLDKWLKSEVVRYKKHPYFWTAVMAASMGTLYQMYMDSLADKYNI